MTPGLHRLGTDFGNGARDGFHFQIDDRYEAYLQAKAALDRRGQPRQDRHACLARNDRERRGHEIVQRWIGQTATRELAAQGVSVPPSPIADESYQRLFAHLQEDAAVIARNPDGSDVITMVHVCFPGNWRPESVIGTSFRQLHGPVPGFADDPPSAQRMVDAMIRRGPYVRFVWSLCADDELDHHPEHGEGRPWQAGVPGHLRVERQITVPFAAVDAALFLIRTYVYPLGALTPQQREVLRLAVEFMPDPVATYKGIAAARPHILAALSTPGLP